MKKMRFSVIFVILFLIFLSAVSAANYVGCGSSISSPGTYELIGHQYDFDEIYNPCINITSDNVYLEGHGAAIRGTGIPLGLYNPDYIGIYAIGRNITIANINVSDYPYGLYSTESGNITLINVSLVHNYYNSFFLQVSDIHFTNVSLLNGSYGSYFNSIFGQIDITDSNLSGSFYDLSASSVKKIRVNNSFIGSYLFISSLNLTYINPNFGEISFLYGGITASNGSNFLGNPGSDMRIQNNSLYVNPLVSGLNKPANLTFYNLGDRGFSNPAIFRDQYFCSNCYNFTSLTASRVDFNVSTWGGNGYSIGSQGLNRGISICGNLNISGAHYVLENSISSVSTDCLNITADNITLDGNYLSIIGNSVGNYSGILLNSVKDVYLENINISNFSNGIYLNSSSNITLLNLNLFNNTHFAIYDCGGSSNNFLIYNNSFGQIKFIDLFNNLTTYGNLTFPGNLRISNNSLTINYSLIASNNNMSFNISIYNFSSGNFNISAIKKNGMNCIDCYNFTSLINSNIVYNISDWTHTFIGEMYGISSCQVLNQSNVRYFLISNISADRGICLNITTDNVYLDAGNYNINGAQNLIYLEPQIDYEFPIGSSHGVVALDNYLFVSYTSSTRIKAFNYSNISNYQNVTFSTSGGGFGKIIYVNSTGKIYGFVASGEVYEVNITSLNATRIITGSGDPGQFGSITSDGNYLYVLVYSSPSQILKYNITNYSLASSITLGSSLIGGHEIHYDSSDGFIYATGLASWIAKINASDLTYINKTLPTSGTDDLTIVDDRIFIGAEGGDYLILVNKTTLSNQVILGVCGGYGFFYDGHYVYGACPVANTLSVIDPLTLKSQTISLISNSNYPNEIAFHNNNIFYTTWGASASMELLTINFTKSNGDTYYAVGAENVNNFTAENLKVNSFWGGIGCGNISNVCNWGGVLFNNVSNSVINKLISLGNYYGLLVNNSNNNLFSNITLNSSLGLYIASSNYTNFTNFNLSEAWASNGLVASESSSNSILFNGGVIGKYIINVTSKLIFNRNSFGLIDFIFGINGSGNNLFGNSNSNIQINNNSIYINSSEIGLNVSVNITVYGLYASFINPLILKDGLTCTDCYNFTSLNAGTVVFNVSSGSNYSIAEGPNPYSLSDCANLSVAGAVYTLQNNIDNYAGTCFNITVDNITLNLNGYYIDGTNYESEAYYGIYASNIVNLTILNGSIKEFGDIVCFEGVCSGSGLYLTQVNNSNIINIRSSNSNTGIILSSDYNNNFYNVSTSNDFSGIYLNLSHNNSFYNVTTLNEGAGFFLDYSSNNWMYGLSASNNYNGVYLSSSSNNTFYNITALLNTNYGVTLASSSNNRLYNVTASNSLVGIMILAGSNQTSINILNIKDNTVAGIYMSSSYNNSLMNIISLQNNIGAYLASSSNNNFYNSTISSGYYGFHLQSSSDNNLMDNLVSQINVGLYLASSSRNNITDTNINDFGQQAIYLTDSPQSENIFYNISVTSTNSAYRDLLINNTLVNNTQFINVNNIGNYSFTGGGSTVTIKDTSYGQIQFITPINGSGSNFTRDIQIGNNSAYISSSQVGLNRSANVTFYGLPTTMFDPIILKDGLTCTDCYNFTSLNAGTVKFNITGYGNYTINSIANPNLDSPYSITACRAINYSNTTYVLQNNITDYNGTCFNVSVDNVVIDLNGHIVDGVNDLATSYFGVLATNVNNITVKNGTITQFGDNSCTSICDGHGIRFLNVNNSLVDNLVISYTQTGISLQSSYSNRINSVSTNNNNNGIYFGLSNYNNLSSIVSNLNANYGLYLFGSSANILNNITTNSNLDSGIYIESNSLANTISNISSNSNSNHGLYLASDSNNITNITLTLNPSGLTLESSSLNNVTNLIAIGNDFGISLSSSNSNSFSIINSTNNSYGFYLSSSSNNTISNNREDYNSNGLYLLSSNLNNFSSSNLDANYNFGVYMQDSILNKFTNTTSNSNSRSIYISSSSYNNFTFGTINDSRQDAIYLNDLPNSNNIFDSISITNTNNSYYDLIFGVDSINNTQFIDMPHIRNYSFIGVGAITTVKKAGNGEVRFLQPINGSGNNLTNDLLISNNSIKISSSKIGLNRSANITLENIPSDITNAKILRDGAICLDCYNFTSLNASTIIFNVTGAGNYTINYTLIEHTPPQVSINSPNAITYSSNSLNINITLNEQGYCEYTLDNGVTNQTLTNIGASNISFYSSITGVSNGNYILSAYCNDSIGNRNDSEIVSFSINVASSGNHGGGSSSGGSNYITISLGASDLSKGIIRALKKLDRYKFTVKNETHYIIVVNISSDKIILEIRSNPYNITLVKDQQTSIDVDGDGYFDALVRYDGNTGTYANLFVMSSSGKVNSEIKTIPSNEDNSDTNQIVSEEETSRVNKSIKPIKPIYLSPLFPILILILVLSCFVLFYFILNGKK